MSIFNSAQNTPKTACPTLDKVIKTRLSANTKARDKTLAKQQALLLDTVGPLASILEDASTGELTMKGTVDAVQTALKLLGNASMSLNRERRKNVIRDLNTNLEEMAEDDSLFVDAAPQLLGDGFTKKAKVRDDELKCLSQASKKTNTKHSSFFRGGRPYNTNTGSYSSRRAARIIGRTDETGKGGTTTGTARTTKGHHPAQLDGRTSKISERQCVKDNTCMPLNYSIPFINQLCPKP